MSERLLSYDPATGMKVYHLHDNESEATSFGLRYEQDVQPVLDYNKEAQNEGFDRRSDMWHAAKVPAVILMEWLTKHGVRYWDKNHAPAVRRLLNSDEYRHLRVKHFIM
jgi:hypothetical protein